ncbi:hypothetical protein RvY_01785 [Ramazzottius varieornatus]|uniref:Uncharacterized protein n=1 Tax=Ramazzottius varieornatus TaxID=947166 RepID=A0A1D1UPL9_RAMVA|nr:hypothetical protein RvY_01785 [Ramazzottius varieornatus]
MWVDKKGLRKLQEKSKNATEYARKVMFHLLITNDEVISLSEIKPDGVGFVKLFGQKNWNAFYEESIPVIKLELDAYGHVANASIAVWVAAVAQDWQPNTQQVGSRHGRVILFVFGSCLVK